MVDSSLDQVNVHPTPTHHFLFFLLSFFPPPQGTIRIESVDVIKISHFDIENLLDEPEIWLLLRAEVVQSFEIVRGKRLADGTLPPPTTRTARNINITSLRTNILSLADFGLVGVNATDSGLNSRAQRRKRKQKQHSAGASMELDLSNVARSVSEDVKSPQNMVKKSNGGPLNTEPLVSL